MGNIKVNDPSKVDSINVIGKEVVKIWLSSMTPFGVANFTTGLKTVEGLAERLGAEIVATESKIQLQKEIEGRVWEILTIDMETKKIDVVVDVKRFLRPSTETKITASDIQIPGYVVRSIHEVRGPLAWLMELGKGREVTVGEKPIFVQMKIAEARLPNGDIVRYNTWDFKPHAIFDAQLSDNTISGESVAHKSEFVLKVADAFCDGDGRLVGKFSPQIEQQLRTIHTTRKSPSYLSGYEIHHNGYGEMLLLPKEIHCRKLAHIGGSWLMNTKNYTIYLENPSTLDTSIGKILTEGLTPEKLETYRGLSIEAQSKFIVSIGDQILQNIGLSDVKIEFVDNLPPTTCGMYSYEMQTITLNRNLLVNPLDALHTELHEIRHAIQSDAIRHPEKYGFGTDILSEWGNNITNYICPELDLEAYILQPIESDAEMWASEMLHNVKNEYYV